MKESGAYKCRGCFWINHDNLIAGSGGYNHWMRAFRDPYPILVTFSTVLFIMWVISGFLGGFANTVGKSRAVRLVVDVFSMSS